VRANSKTRRKKHTRTTTEKTKNVDERERENESEEERGRLRRAVERKLLAAAIERTRLDLTRLAWRLVDHRRPA